LPQYIELHNFTPANNLQQKLANWGLLNSKVFNRFGLNVPFSITQNICNAKPGYVEVFLHNLRYKIEEKLNELERNNGHSRSKMSPRNSMHMGAIMGSMSSPASMTGGKNKQISYEMRMEYESKVQECLQQAEQIEVLQAKIRRLEHLLELKEARIDELTDRLDKFRPTGMTAEQPGLVAAKKSNIGNKNRNSIMIS
jgi:hypothetical protein